MSKTKTRRWSRRKPINLEHYQVVLRFGCTDDNLVGRLGEIKSIPDLLSALGATPGIHDLEYVVHSYEPA